MVPTKSQSLANYLRACLSLVLPLFVCFTPTATQTATTQVPNRWIIWRDEQISHILEPTFRSEQGHLLSREEVISRSAEAYGGVEQARKKDPEVFKHDPELARSMTNFVRFVTAQHWMALKDNEGKNTHVLGYQVPDNTYWSHIFKEAELPDLLQSPQFLKLMSDPAKYHAAVDLIHEQNKTLPEDRKWLVMLFRAQFIKSVDRTTYSRMLVLAPNLPRPDGPVDKWVQFAIATPGHRNVEELSVSVVAVRKPASNGPSTNAVLMDFLRIKDRASGAIRLSPNALLPQNPSKNCYDCHKAAVIPIHPEAEYTFDDQGSLIDKQAEETTESQRFNARIRGHGRSNFGPLDSGAYGPCIAPDRERSDDFIRTAAKGLSLSPESISRIRSAMNCSTCHDQFAKINYPLAVRTDRDVKSFKGERGMVETYITKGWMPPGNDLSPIERRVLWRSLMKEYFDPETQKGVFVDWLRGKDEG